MYPIGEVIPRYTNDSAFLWVVAGYGFIYGIPMLMPWFTTWIRGARLHAQFVLSTYAILTLLPIIFTFFQPVYEPRPITENHALAPFPQRQADPVRYTADAEAWLMDHIGLRALMIRTKNELDYRILRSSSRVYFGQENTIFLRRWSDERFPALQQILEHYAQRATLQERIRTQVAWYADRGITCYVTIVPSKDVTYPEFLPWYVPRYDYQQLLAFEDELRNTGVHVVPTYAILQDIKPQYDQLYYPQDFHWNRISAYYVNQYVATDLAHTHQAHSSSMPVLTSEFQRVPINDRVFAALLTDAFPFVTGIEGVIVNAPAGAWQEFRMQDLKISHWQHADSYTAVYPNLNLHIIGDSFSMNLLEAGATNLFANVYRSTRPSDPEAYAQWLKDARITTVIWQLRDVSLPLYFENQEDQ